MADVTIRWAGPADAGSASVYRIEYTLNNADWTTLAVNQAAVSPYASPVSALGGDTSREAATVALADATAFSSSGYGYLDDALIQWTGKSGNALTGVIWHSGYGTYAAGSAVYEAHESATISGITISLNAALFRVTHTNSLGLVSPPAYLWHFSPPTSPANCCTVVTVVNSDLGMEARAGIGVQAYLAKDIDFSLVGGSHLDKGQSLAKTQTTNAFGLAFHSCWRSSARQAIDGSHIPYNFVLDSGNSSEKLTVSVQTIPDQPWVLLSQIIDGVGT